MNVVETFPGSETVFYLSDFVVSDPNTPFYPQLIVGITPSSKVRYPDLVRYSLQDMIAVPPAVSAIKFPPTPSETCPTSTL